MPKVIDYINRKLSVRLSLTVVLAVTVLMTAALTVMFLYARKAIKEEAIQTAQQTLEGAMQHIDNILLCVEQATGNVYWDLLLHLDQPERMRDYTRRLVEANPYVDAAAIAFEPYYYQARGKYFINYVYHSANGRLASSEAPIIQADTYGNRPYCEQDWYAITMNAGRPTWIDPINNKETDDEPILSFCLPIYDRQGQKVGVAGADITLRQLSHVVHAAKPTPHAYCVLLGRDGSYIVHPDSTTRLHDNIFINIQEEADTAMLSMAKAMVEGQTGHKTFSSDGTNYYVFYQPFHRATVPGRANHDMGWSIATIYPEDDIMGEYNRLLYYMIAIAITGLLALLALCQLVIHRQLLPLRMLSKSAQHIAESLRNGHPDTATGQQDGALTTVASSLIPRSRQHDEIGLLQNHFRQMQQALGAHIGQLDHLTDALKQREQQLSGALHQAEEADRMKTTFLHNMTNQMLAPASAIAHLVSQLNDDTTRLSQQQVAQLTEEISQQSQVITDLLDQMITDSRQT